MAALPPHKYKTTATPLVELAPKPKVALVIVNPNSGARKGIKALAVIKPIFETAGLTVRVLETKHAGHCAEICANDDLSDVELLVPIGGDGTLHEACNGLMTRTDGARERLIIAVIPAGSGNTFAFDLGITDFEQAAKIAVAGMYRHIDVAQVNAVDDGGNLVAGKKPMYSINMVGWAMPSKVMKIANAYRGFGCGAWYGHAMRSYVISNDSYRAKVSAKLSDGTELAMEESFALFQVQNTVHVGDKLPACPEAKLDDGFLDLLLIVKAGRLANLKTLTLAKKGLHTTRKNAKYVKCTEVTLLPSDNRLKGPNTINIDGELSCPSPCKIVVVPRALRVFCPF